jgi:hypothetical protein
MANHWIRYGDHLRLLAESTFWRPIPHVHVPRMPPPSACSVCSRKRPRLLFQLPQMRWHHLSGHDGPPMGPSRRIEKLRARLKWGAGGTTPIKPRGMHERTYQRILGMLAYHEVVRKQGAGYARNYRPDQHRAQLWRQCRNRFAGLGG